MNYVLKVSINKTMHVKILHKKNRRKIQTNILFCKFFILVQKEGKIKRHKETKKRFLMATFMNLKKHQGKTS